MRILFFIILSMFILSNSYSIEIIDCSKETSFIKKLDCKAKNLKTKLNEKQTETKEKISKKAKELKAKVETN
mgnify:CR=1 FL=1|tara:strand:- start:126 stop:341 length:216 start_codon:yes stop_codon:yes gene_type:complete